MKQTLKNYLDDFSVLPKAVKFTIYFIIAVLISACLWQSVSNYLTGKKVESLEKMNVQLEKAAIIAQENARISEQKAIDENIRAENLESQLIPIEKEIETSDEKLKTQSKKSADLNNSLQRVRVSRPTDQSAIDLERRLKDRYDQTNRSR